MVLDGIPWCCMALDGTVWYWMKSHGINWKCDADAVPSVVTIQLPALESIMSSTLEEHNSEHRGSNCIDGDLTTLCHSTTSRFKEDTFPWIALDLNTEVDISKVEMMNANQQTNANFKVYVTSTKPRFNRVRWRSILQINTPTDTTSWFKSGTLLGRSNGPFQAGQKITILKTSTTSGSIDLEMQVENKTCSPRSE